MWMSCLPAVIILSIVRVWSSSSMAMPHPSRRTHRAQHMSGHSVEYPNIGLFPSDLLALRLIFSMSLVLSLRTRVDVGIVDLDAKVQALHHLERLKLILSHIVLSLLLVRVRVKALPSYTHIHTEALDTSVARTRVAT